MFCVACAAVLPSPVPLCTPVGFLLPPWAVSFERGPLPVLQRTPDNKDLPGPVFTNDPRLSRRQRLSHESKEHPSPSRVNMCLVTVRIDGVEVGIASKDTGDAHGLDPTKTRPNSLKREGSRPAQRSGMAPDR